MCSFFCCGGSPSITPGYYTPEMRDTPFRQTMSSETDKPKGVKPSDKKGAKVITIKTSDSVEPDKDLRTPVKKVLQGNTLGGHFFSGTEARHLGAGQKKLNVKLTKAIVAAKNAGVEGDGVETAERVQVAMHHQETARSAGDLEAADFRVKFHVNRLKVDKAVKEDAEKRAASQATSDTSSQFSET